MEGDAAARALAVYDHGMGSAPAVARDPPQLLLRAAAAEETAPPPSPQSVVDQILTPVPAASLSGLMATPAPDGLSLGIPLLVGVDDVAKELWLLVIPTPEFATSMLRLFEQQGGGVAPLCGEAGLANNTMPPLLLCGAREGEGLEEICTNGMGMVVARVQLGSSPKIMKSSSPSTSSRHGKRLVRRVKLVVFGRSIKA